MDGLLLQKPEKEAAGQKKAENFIRMDRIAPYVRYVNYKIFEGGTLLPERIIYDHELIYLSLIHISGNIGLSVIFRHFDSAFSHTDLLSHYIKPLILDVYKRQGRIWLWLNSACVPQAS